MRRVLLVLFSLCFLVEVTKGGVVLCNHASENRRQANLQNGENENFEDNSQRRELYYEERSSAGDNDNFEDDSLRKESVRNNKLRAMLMEDSDESNYRAAAKRNDYSALEGSLRADTLRAYADQEFNIAPH